MKAILMFGGRPQHRSHLAWYGMKKKQAFKRAMQKVQQAKTDIDGEKVIEFTVEFQAVQMSMYFNFTGITILLFQSWRLLSELFLEMLLLQLLVTVQWS